MVVPNYKTVKAFTAVGQTDPINIQGRKSGVIRGTFVGTVVLEYSEDDNATWNQDYDKDGNAIQWTAPARFSLEEWSVGVNYRLRVSAYTSGTINAGFIN